MNKFCKERTMKKKSYRELCEYTEVSNMHAFASIHLHSRENDDDNVEQPTSSTAVEMYSFATTTTNSTNMIQYTWWNQCYGGRWVSIWKPNWKEKLLTIFATYKSHYVCLVYVRIAYTVRWLLHLYLYLPLKCCALFCSSRFVAMETGH